jgi:hypothetical protein
MNTSSTPVPGPESNGNLGEETPEQKTYAHHLGQTIKSHFRWWHIGLGVGIFILVVSLIASRESDRADAILLVVSAACTIFLGFAALVWWRGSRTERYFGIQRVEAPETNSVPTDSWDWKTFWSWKNFVLMGILFSIGRGISDRTKESERNKTAVEFRRGFAVEKQARAGRVHATLAYWQTAVANFHQIRFAEPIGDEPASVYIQRQFSDLRKFVDGANGISTTNVDVDLLTMARRHLALEERFMLWKGKIDELMKQEDIREDNATIGDRNAEGRMFISKLLADPSILTKLPEGALRTCFEETVELEQQRMIQLRDIEIMQAVLQERYSGTKFPLPNLGQ